MSFLHLDHNSGTMVWDCNGYVIRKSKNLRGMLDYARLSKVATVRAQKHGYSAERGILNVTYCNGAVSIAEFASYQILLEFVKARKSWRKNGASFSIE